MWRGAGLLRVAHATARACECRLRGDAARALCVTARELHLRRAMRFTRHGFLPDARDHALRLHVRRRARRHARHLSAGLCFLPSSFSPPNRTEFGRPLLLTVTLQQRRTAPGAALAVVKHAGGASVVVAEGLCYLRVRGGASHLRTRDSGALAVGGCAPACALAALDCRLGPRTESVCRHAQPHDRRRPETLPSPRYAGKRRARAPLTFSRWLD
jgi:hypothetical protein